MGMDVGLFWTCSPSDPSVRHWNRLFDSSPIKGEGVMRLCWLCSPSPPCRPVDSRLRGNDGEGCARYDGDDG